jgi:hypothetical protein
VSENLRWCNARASICAGNFPKDERVIRFCFAKTEDLLMQAAEQLAGV